MQDSESQKYVHWLSVGIGTRDDNMKGYRLADRLLHCPGDDCMYVSKVRTYVL